jgi:hypothetical protein
MKIDQTLCVDKPTILVNKNNDDDKTNFAKWEHSNRMSLMIIKSTIMSAIREDIP